jgi:hypothetical protein
MKLPVFKKVCWLQELSVVSCRLSVKPVRVSNSLRTAPFACSQVIVVEMSIPTGTKLDSPFALITRNRQLVTSR